MVASAVTRLFFSSRNLPMRCCNASRSRSKGRPRVYRPQFDTFESRLPPGDMIGLSGSALWGLSMFGSGVATPCSQVALTAAPPVGRGASEAPEVSRRWPGGAAGGARPSATTGSPPTAHALGGFVARNLPGMEQDLFDLLGAADLEHWQRPEAPPQALRGTGGADQGGAERGGGEGRGSTAPASGVVAVSGTPVAAPTGTATGNLDLVVSMLTAGTRPVSASPAPPAARAARNQITPPPVAPTLAPVVVPQGAQRPGSDQGGAGPNGGGAGPGDEPPPPPGALSKFASNSPYDPQKTCTGSPVQDGDGVGGNNNPSKYSDASVRYFDGVVQLAWTDLRSDGFGAVCDQRRSWSNGDYNPLDFTFGRPRSDNGSGMVVEQLPYLTGHGSHNFDLYVITSATSARIYDWDTSDPQLGPRLVPRFFTKDQLAFTDGEYVLTDTAGDQTHFYDTSNSTGLSPRWGKFKSMTDPAGNVTTVTRWTADGKAAEVQRSTPVGQTPHVVESFVYSYVASDVNQGLINNVTLRRQVDGGDWTVVRQVDYTYYKTGEANGNPTDLKTAIVEDAAGNALDTTYYRYWPRVGSGVDAFDGLKYVVNPQSYARLAAAVGDPFSASDQDLAPYADNFFQYDSQKRVIKEVAQGTSCSCAADGGQGTFTYSYSISPFGVDYNTWKYKTIETLPDNSPSFVSRNIVYTNGYGEIMLKVYESGAPGHTQQWDTFYKYDDAGRVILQANPSAVTGYDEARPDLLNNVSGHYQFLRDNQGEIQLTDYYPTTTATEATPGGVAGYFQDSKLQQGQLGTPVLQSSKQYVARTGNMFDVTVTTPGGTSAADATHRFTYVPPPLPVVTGFSQSSASVLGGSALLITGTGFTGAVRVNFGTTLQTGFPTVLSDTTIRVTIPAHAPGVVDVTVVTPAGTSVVTAADHFTFAPPPAPVVTGLSLTTGNVFGGVVMTVIGTGFTGATQVTVGGTPAGIASFISDTAISFRTPAHAEGVVDVRVTTPAGTSDISAADQFTYMLPPRPAVTGLSLTSDTTLGGAVVTVLGTAFTGATAVSFGGMQVSLGVSVNSDTSVTVHAPVHLQGVVDVTVTTPGGTSQIVPADHFTYVPPPRPVVTAIGPISGSTVGNYLVTILGSGFTQASQVTFGGTPAASFLVNSPGEITARARAAMAGTVEITVTTPGGTSDSTAADHFTYVRPSQPVVTGVGAATGTTPGGNLVTVTGNGFTGASAVSFGGTPGTRVTVLSDSALTVQAPAHNEGTVDVTVTTPGGTSALTGADQYTYVTPAAPVVTDLGPNQGLRAGGDLVAIIGTGFSGATTVSFGGTPGTGITVLSDNALTVLAPGHALGIVDVTVTTPGGTSAITPADQFTYVTDTGNPGPPVVTGLSPNQGVNPGSAPMITVTIIGSGFLQGFQSVVFGTTAATGVAFLSDNALTVKVPAHAEGVVDVRVTTARGTSAITPADQFAYIIPPTPPVVTGLGATSDTTFGGVTLAVLGSGFSGASDVSFGGTPAASFTVLSDNAISVSVPPHPLDTFYPVASTTVYRNVDGTGAETTQYAYTWYPGTARMQSRTVTKPTISAAQNGPGTPDVETTVYDVYGRPIWTRDGDGFINYTEYDQGTGAVTKSIVDVDTTRTSDFQNLPAGWTTPPGGGLHLETQMGVDALGREIQRVDPNGNITYTVYNDANHERRVYPGWNPATNTPTGPTRVWREDRAHSPSYVETLTMSAVPNVGADGGPDGSEPVSRVENLSRTFTSLGGQVIERDAYFSLAGVAYATDPYLGTAGTNYYPTTYGYDDQGRRNQVVLPTGTINRTVYDGLGRVVSIWVGTNDMPADGGEWSPDDNTPPANMVQLTASVYDNGGVGDGNLTQQTQFPGGGAAPRVTQNFYDWRDRLVASKQGVQAGENDGTHRPIVYTQFDNLNEVVSQERYDGDGISITITNGAPDRPPANLLRAKMTTQYDDQGRVFRTDIYSVNQMNGTVSTTSLVNGVWYNHRGLVIKTVQPGGPVTKSHFDGAGRLVTNYVTDGLGDATWADANTVANNNVLSQTEAQYDGDGNPIVVISRQRFHDETRHGELGIPASSNMARARASYMASYYDAANRLTDDVDVGTNGGTPYTRPDSVPPGSDTVLVTHTDYDTAGRVAAVIDPRGLVTGTTYDLLGRTVQTVAALSGDGTPTDNTNQTTAFTYDGDNHILTETAVLPGGVTQTTQYVYGITDPINSNDLLAQVIYPDNGQNLAENYGYNTLGQMVSKTDRNGSTHAYRYDVLGRQTADAVTALGAGVDGQVLRLETAYDTGGRPFQYTSYDNPVAGHIVNQVRQDYNGLGQLITEYQAHGGAVDTTTTPKVQYAYSEMAGGANHSRLVSMTYPNGRVLAYDYAAGVDDAISRLTSQADGSGILEAYSYLGLNTVVQRSHPQPGVDLTHIKRIGEPDGDAGDPYTGLDRFGRVVDQRWLHSADGSATDRFQYGYDRDDNRLYRDNLVNTAFGELYHANGAANGYDPLNRLTDFSRGTLNASHDAVVGSPSQSQNWGLDALGNWSTVTTNGTVQSRDHNAQNQITDINGNPLAYDNNGNLTTDDAGQAYTYDAWNRLVAVQDASGTTLSSYAYDALGRRVIETSGAAVDLYFSKDWQVLEERASATVQAQYVWSQVYVDALVLRDRGSERLYVQQDANWNVTVLVNASGVVQERYVYDPYGAVTVLNPVTWLPTDPSVNQMRYMHQAGRYDYTSSLYLFRHRDYSPTLGRWMQQDPLGLAAGTNWYDYVLNNPTNSVDPSGLYAPRRKLKVPKDTTFIFRLTWNGLFLVWHVRRPVLRHCLSEVDFEGYYLIPNAPCNFLCIISGEEWDMIKRASVPRQSMGGRA